MSDPEQPPSSSTKPVDDGAKERLVLDPQSAHPSHEDRIEMKYVPETKNGERKVTNVRVAFVGMGKEELMKYANDPYWVKVRWTLFVLFWFLWLTMLAAAIAVIILAPKCSTSYEPIMPDSPVVYEVEVQKTGTEGSSLDVLDDVVTSLKGSGVDLIVVNTFMKTDDDGSVVNFSEVDPSYGSSDKVKDWLKKMRDADYRIVMSFVPNYTSDKHQWFQKSINKDEPYADYYIWAKEQPNNWKTVNDTATESAWILNDVRKECFLHQFKSDQPDLNFRNNDVVGNFTNIIKFWMDHGFYGLHVDKAEFLFEDKDLRNEPVINSPSSLAPSSEYRMLNHLYTTNLPETVSLVGKWSNLVTEENKGFFSTSHLKDATTSTMNRSPVIDVSFSKNTMEKQQVDELFKLMSSRLTHSEQSWEWNVVGLDTPKEDCLALTRALEIFSVLLPGVPIIKESSSEIDFSSVGGLFPSIFKKLLLQRKLLKKDDVKINHNDTILSYSRIKDTQSGYMAFINLGPSATAPILSSASELKLFTVLAISRPQDNLFFGQGLNSPFEIPSLTTLVVEYLVKTQPS